MKIISFRFKLCQWFFISDLYSFIFWHSTVWNNVSSQSSNCVQVRFFCCFLDQYDCSIDHHVLMYSCFQWSVSGRFSMHRHSFRMNITLKQIRLFGQHLSVIRIYLSFSLPPLLFRCIVFLLACKIITLKCACLDVLTRWPTASRSKLYFIGSYWLLTTIRKLSRRWDICGNDQKRFN